MADESRGTSLSVYGGGGWMGGILLCAGFMSRGGTAVPNGLPGLKGTLCMHR
jgi:hypothetical protein